MIRLGLIIIGFAVASVTCQNVCRNMAPIKLSEDGLGWTECQLTPSDLTIEITMSFSSSLLEGKAPKLNTEAWFDHDAASLETTTFLDVIALTNAGPSVWSFQTKKEKDEVRQKISRYLFINKPEHGESILQDADKQNSPSSSQISNTGNKLQHNKAKITAQRKQSIAQDVSVRLVFSTTATIKANQKIGFKFNLTFEEITLSLNKTQRVELEYESSVIYQFKHETNDRKRIRVQVTRPDIGNLTQKTDKREGCSKAVGSNLRDLCSCSVVTIQKMGTPFEQTEREVLLDSEWQTMIGRSVIDIEVGGDSNDYKNGFYIVIVKKKNDTDCKLNSLDLNIDGKFDTREGEEEAEDESETLQSNETVVGNETLHMRKHNTIFDTKRYSERFPYDVHVSEVDDDVLIYSVITISIYLGLIIFALVLSRVFKIPVTGRVVSPEEHNPFSVILKVAVTPRISQLKADLKKQTSDTPDGKNSSNGENAENKESPLEMNEVSKENDNNSTTVNRKKASFITRNRKRIPSLSPETVKKVQCFYIEMCDSSDNEESPTKPKHEDTVDGNFEETETMKPAESSSGLHSVKKALQIDDKKSVRIVPRCNKREIRHVRLQEGNTLADFATNCDPKMFPKTLFMKSDMYYWIMMLAGIFYILPAIQLMLMAQTLNSQTGSEDICYYNFLCRRTSRFFQDYGHVFSNVSYIFCGIAFIALVFIRRYRRRKAMIRAYCEKNHPSWPIDDKKMKELKKRYSDRNVEFLNQCGIPEQYGIFFAMGLGLIMEGILSASYHICPVDESFQFDTTFMYIITVLVFLKLYQFRHPDITANAYVIFGFIAIFLVFEAIGYYSPKGVYMFFFVFTYIIVIFAVIIDMYFQKNFRLAMEEIFFSRSESREATYDDYKKELKAGSTARLIFFAVMGTLNLLLAAFFLYKMSYAKDSIVSNYLLVVFGINMVGYGINYAIMKCYHVFKMKHSAESITFTCWVYITLTIIFMVVGMVFFKLYQEKTTLISPSESRHLNAECTFWFFDKHDIWHFCSAFGLLFTFMTLLTMEDNNTSTPWDKIPVF